MIKNKLGRLKNGKTSESMSFQGWQFKEKRDFNGRFMVGNKLSEIVKNKISKSNKGKHHSPKTEFKKGMTNSKKMKSFSITTRIHSDGKKRNYIKLPNGKWVKYYRYIMEQKIRRKLKQEEVIHHINGNMLDDRLENLKIMSNSKHRKEHPINITKEGLDKIIKTKKFKRHKKVPYDLLKKCIDKKLFSKEICSYFGINNKMLNKLLKEYGLEYDKMKNMGIRFSSERGCNNDGRKKFSFSTNVIPKLEC